MSELGKKYEELIEDDARAAKEDTVKELSTYEKERTRRVADGEDEQIAIENISKLLESEIDEETQS